MTRDDLMIEFGWNLRRQLEKYSITQNELAQELTVSRQLISRYINGECLPSLDKLLNIMYIIGCDLEDLVDTDEFIEED